MARDDGGDLLVLADCGPAWPAGPGTGGSAGKLRAHSAVPGSPPTQQSNIPGHADDRIGVIQIFVKICCAVFKHGVQSYKSLFPFLSLNSWKYLKGEILKTTNILALA